MSIFLTKVADATTPASLFAAHYDFLMDWALHFARDNRALAEDMVQEAFVKFVTSQSVIEDPESVRPLLYTYLNNVHRDELRKALRHPVQNMTTIEFDSLQMSLRERGGADPIEVQDELRNIMSYLCWRKESLKPASILLLRFFYSFSPDEITKICLISRQSVDHGLSTAREEVRTHIRSAGRLSVVRAGGPPPTVAKNIARHADHFTEELEAVLARAKSTPCLSREALLGFYVREPRQPISCALLAHIVSCKRCLQIVHLFYALPDISDKGSKAIVEMVKRPSSGRGRKKDASSVKMDIGRLLDIASQRSREIYEHRPKSLLLIVNGEAVVSQDVSSSINTQRVEWKPDRPLDFVEVESEQGVGLLVMPVRVFPPDSPPQISREVVLSNGRSLTAILTFTGLAYTIEVTYSDPLFFAGATVEARDLYEVELFGDSPHAEDGLRELLPTLIAGESERSESVSGKWRKFFHWIKMPEFNPVFATAVVLAVASVMCFLIWTTWRPVSITANELLVKAESWDASSRANSQPGVVRQKVRISSSLGSMERTIYRDVQGVRIQKRQKNGAQVEQLKTRLEGAGVDWNEPLSVTSYQDWHDHQHVRRDRISRSGDQLLTLTTDTPDGPVSQQSITVREGDFHPVQRTIEFRASGLVQIAELEYEVMPSSKADPGWFELLSPASIDPRTVRFPIARLAVALPSDTQLDLAELETRVVLSHLNTDVSGRLELVRSPQGIEVKGIVSTPDRKLQLEQELRKIPHVGSEIYTFDEMEHRPAAATEVTRIAAETAVATVSPLQTYLLAKGWSRDAIGSLSQDLFNRSAEIERESRALSDLANRFREPDKLDEQGRAALEELRSQHRNHLTKALRSEQDLLAKIGISVPAGVPGGKAETIRDANLDRLAKNNRTLCNELLSETSEQTRNADPILSGIAASLFQITRELAQNQDATEPQANSSASLQTPHGKQ